jgi:hypothetical protein
MPNMTAPRRAQDWFQLPGRPYARSLRTRRTRSSGRAASQAMRAVSSVEQSSTTRISRSCSVCVTALSSASWIKCAPLYVGMQMLTRGMVSGLPLAVAQVKETSDIASNCHGTQGVDDAPMRDRKDIQLQIHHVAGCLIKTRFQRSVSHPTVAGSGLRENSTHGAPCQDVVSRRTSSDTPPSRCRHSYPTSNLRARQGLPAVSSVDAHGSAIHTVPDVIFQPTHAGNVPP